MPTGRQYKAAKNRLKKKENFFKCLAVVVIVCPFLLYLGILPISGFLVLIYIILIIILISYVSYLNAFSPPSKTERLIDEWEERGMQLNDPDDSTTLSYDELKLNELKELYDKGNDPDFV